MSSDFAFSLPCERPRTYTCKSVSVFFFFYICYFLLLIFSSLLHTFYYFFPGLLHLHIFFSILISFTIFWIFFFVFLWLVFCIGLFSSIFLLYFVSVYFFLPLSADSQLYIFLHHHSSLCRLFFIFLHFFVCFLHFTSCLNFYFNILHVSINFPCFFFSSSIFPLCFLSRMYRDSFFFTLKKAVT